MKIRNRPQRIPDYTGNKIPLIDAVRLVSVLFVLGCHILFASPFNPDFHDKEWQLFDSVFRDGAYGVTCFFVVSGFLITRLLAQSSPDWKRLPLKEFYIRRAARILPLFAAILLVGLTAVLVIPTRDFRSIYIYRMTAGPADPTFWCSMFTFSFNWFLCATEKTKGFGYHWLVLWSLAVEEQFYLVYPLMLRKLGKPRRILIALVSLVCFGFVFRVAVQLAVPGSEYWSSFSTFANVDQLAIGGILHFAHENLRSQLQRNQGQSWLFTTMGAAMVVWTYVQSSHAVQLNRIFDTTTIAIGTGCFLLGGMNLKIFKSDLFDKLSTPGR